MPRKSRLVRSPSRGKKGKVLQGPVDPAPISQSGFMPPPPAPQFPKRPLYIVLFLVAVWLTEVLRLHTHGLITMIVAASLMMLSIIERTHTVTECAAQLIDWGAGAYLHNRHQYALHRLRKAEQRAANVRAVADKVRRFGLYIKTLITRVIG